ncbi:ATP-dependent Clp protease ATP-binding subunit ClpA [Ruminococcaceae bacterium FB2012]|nr:ATP-dependent Clp protease ATP-binding subunit ClpA [Ruminococcaceae bacterium FB2012]
MEQVLCSKCGKRPAVMFISQVDPNNPKEKKHQALCLQCACELGISQSEDFKKMLGISDEEIKNMTDQLMELNDGNDFEMGGSGTMPGFLSQLFGGLGGSPSKDENPDYPARPGGRDDGTQSKRPRDAKKEKKKELKFLSNYCTNLTEKARNNELDNIIGRDTEIARVVQILSRRQKNNPCLIGEPGVGKTAIAEGIAQRIVAGNVPFRIRDKEIYLLDLTALIAGTQFRGQFESRCKGLVEEVKREGNVILFIDEVHNLVGAGDSEGSMNAANILKPALSRGEVQVIGATTFKEYRKYIEKDSALERRFQPVTVSEPTVEDTVAVLKGISKYYTAHHRVNISEHCLRMCAVLSERYINDRFLPDKAIDLLDEACAVASINSKELTEYDKLNAELKKHRDLLAELEESSEPDYEKLAEEKAEVSRLENSLKEVEKAVTDLQVTDADISTVIEMWTGIPANKIVETQYEKIRGLKAAMSRRIIGQDKAVDKVVKAIKRTRVQLSKRRRPASFIFVGPTGVGKTELVKVLGEELFDATEPIIRIDMSEYMEKHSVSKLIGSPPGYVGFDEAGQLTEKVRRRPYSVILFDEIEKAHPDVMNIMLQILDEGRLRDSQGRSVSFENTVVVMTSNAGSTSKEAGVGFNKSEGEISEERAMKALREFLRPEFLGRVDEIVVFDPLTEEDYAEIAGLMLDEMKQPLSENGISFAYDGKATALIARKTHGGKLGARDIRHYIRAQVEDKVAELLIDKGEGSVSAVGLTADGDELRLDIL